MSKLNEVKIRNAKPRDEIYMMNDGHGLYARIFPSGHKSFVLRKHNRIKTIGVYGDDGMTLHQARQHAHIDPKLATLKFNKAKMGHLVQEYFNTRIEPRYKSPDQVKLYLFTDLAPLAKTKVVDVTRAELATILSNKAKHSGPVAANRLLSVVKRLFRFARASGTIEVNPAELLDRDIAGGKERPRDRVLDEGKGSPEQCVEIRQLWWGDLKYRSLFRFLLASGQRIGEARNARWRDFHDGKWHIPATKSDRSHWVAISALMQAELDAQPRGKPDDFVFGVTTDAAQAALIRWQRREKMSEPRWTAHDLRRTMSTRMNDAGVAPHVVEKILNHKMGGVMAVYNRASYEKERIAAQKAWSDLLKKLAGSERSAYEKEVAKLLDTEPTKKETRGRPKESKLHAAMYEKIYEYRRKHGTTIKKTIKELVASKTKVDGRVFAETTWRSALNKHRDSWPSGKAAGIF